MENYKFPQKNTKLEAEIMREILEYLDEHTELLFWRSNNIPVFGRNNGGDMRFRSLPKHTPRGLPDIVVIHKGKFIGLEVKKPKGLIRKEQIDFGENLYKAGASYYIVYSVDDTIKALKNENAI